MTFEEFEKNLEAIRNSGDEALTAIEYTELTDFYNSTVDEKEELNKVITDLKNENDKLREINSRLQLDYGKTIIKEKTVINEDNEDTEEITDEEFIDAINDLF